MFSVNGWNSGLVACSLVTCRSCLGRLAKGRSPEGEGTIMQRRLTQEQIRKSRYKGSERKGSSEGSSENCRWGRVFWTTDLKKYKTADLVPESTCRFRLEVKLIAIKHNERLLCYLFSYITLLMSDLWLELNLWSRLPSQGWCIASVPSTSHPMPGCNHNYYYYLLSTLFKRWFLESLTDLEIGLTIGLYLLKYKRSKTEFTFWWIMHLHPTIHQDPSAYNPLDHLELRLDLLPLHCYRKTLRCNFAARTAW